MSQLPAVSAPTADLTPTSPEAALERWQSLEPVSIEFMIGRWRGEEIATGHPMNGLMSVLGWYGKAFIDAETVHPLLFWDRRRKGVFAVHPARLPMNLRVPKTAALRAAVVLGRPWLLTEVPTARLRLVEMHGATTAAMVYDDRPIVDGFRQIDDHTVMGIMDRRGDATPLFFVLHRDDASTITLSYR